MQEEDPENKNKSPQKSLKPASVKASKAASPMKKET